jgi:putative oxidoreductase
MERAEGKMASIRLRVLAALGKLRWLPPLFARITLGVLFVSTGWLKLHDLGKVTAFMGQLGLPFPAFTAGLVGTVELVCCGLLLLGLFTRIASIPLIVTMIVALVTAKASEIHSLPNLFFIVEFTYIAMLVYLVIGGPGAFSVDTAIAHAMERPPRDDADMASARRHRGPLRSSSATA